MADDVYTTRTSGEIYVQVDGPNTAPVYLGSCVDLDDITEDKGGLSELLQCFDGAGGWEAYGALYNPPSEIAFKLTLRIGKKLHILERIKNCRFPMYIHVGRCGKAGTFQNWDRSYSLDADRMVGETLMGLVHGKEDREARMSFDGIALPPLVKSVKLTVKRQSIAEVNALNDLAFGLDNICSGACGPAQGAGDEGLVVADAGVGVSANTRHTDDGATFTLGATDPFGNNEHISSVVRLDMGTDTPRYIVARGVTDAGAPAEIAYTDDDGATWTRVNVGALNGQYAVDPESLFAIDKSNIWVALSDGYIYKSEDAGLSWVAQESGVITAEDLMSVKFYDSGLGYAAGDNNTLLITENGGLTWSALVGPAGQAGVEVRTIMPTSEQRLFVGYDGGKLFYTENQGDTWAERSLPVAAVNIRSIDFIDELHGIMAVNLAGPVGKLLMTEDGGYTWIALDTDTNSGINAVQFIHPFLAWAVGEVNGGTAVVLKAYAP